MDSPSQVDVVVPMLWVVNMVMQRLEKVSTQTRTYVTVSTLKPIVGIVVTTSPNLSLYKIVVLPAAVKGIKG